MTSQTAGAVTGGQRTGLRRRADRRHARRQNRRNRCSFKPASTSRFHLVVHTDEKEMPIYALVVAKGGPKNLAEPTGETPQFIGRRGIVTCKKTSMKRFAEVALSMRMGRNVVDRTGIDGEYDFVLRYSEEQGAAAASDTSAPDFLTALQEQLGLKLESARGPVEVIVVDHVEKASGN